MRFQIKNELPMELFSTPTIELLDWIFSNGDSLLLWMPISMLRPDRRTSTIAVMRRTSTWWSFSACDQRSTPMISRLGSACEWPVGEEQKEQKRKNIKNIESKESKKNTVHVSDRWVWVFCSEEEKKEEWIKKKRERKNNGEGEKKKGLMDMPLSDGFWVLKTSFSCFYFWWLSSIFESPSNKNHNPKLIQTNHHLWNPYDLDDGNRRLSDITQNSSHPNKLLATSILYNKKSGV